MSPCIWNFKLKKSSQKVDYDFNDFFETYLNPFARDHAYVHDAEFSFTWELLDWKTQILSRILPCKSRFLPQCYIPIKIQYTGSMGGFFGVFEVDWIFFTQILMLNVTRFRVEYWAFFDLDTTIFEEPCTGNKKNESFSNICQILNFLQ